MSIASEITRINTNIAAAYTALDGKGATLPAAGSQNSANLADTIDTITTGGGGNLTFAEIDRIINAIDVSAIANEDYSSLTNNGWVFDYVNINMDYAFNHNYSGAVGMVFDKIVSDTIYVKTKAICVPESATVTAVSTTTAGTTYRVDFAQDDTERFVIFSYGGIDGLGYDAVSLDTSSSSASRAIINSCVKYINCTLTDLTVSGGNASYSITSEINILKLTALGCSDYLEDFTLNGITYTGNLNSISGADSIPTIFFKDLGKKFFGYCEDMSYGSAVINATATQYLMQYTPEMYGYFANCKECGLVFDASSLTVSTWYIGAMGGASSSANKNSTFPHELFIILPNKNVYWSWDESTSPRPISLASLQFLATNAPTVSGKTLTIGSENIARAGGASGTIISTLTGKGWTVQ